jgi:hypothetical protein
MNWKNKEAALILAKHQEAKASRLLHDMQQQEELARQLEERQLNESARSLSERQVLQDEIAELKFKLEQERSDKKNISLKLELEKNVRINAENEVEILKSELDCIRRTTATKDSIEEELHEMISCLTKEKENLVLQIGKLRENYETRQHAGNEKICQLKWKTSASNNDHMHIESELMHAKNVIVQLESSLRDAEEQMNFYLEIENDHKLHSKAISEEFVCMENNLKSVLSDKRCYEDQIIFLKTENAELHAKLKVEKMLRLKNFEHFSSHDGVCRLTNSSGFESPCGK